MPPGFMATISKENQFSFSQISEDTLLLFIDEWSTNFLDEDILKRLLQGLNKNVHLLYAWKFLFFAFHFRLRKVD